MHFTLSKSDFKIASTCTKKLEYKKKGYPTSLEENEFMEMLAESGYTIGKLATLLYPGIEVKGNTQIAISKTKELLLQKNITLHEAAIQSGQKLIRIDILKKTGNTFSLIEVKAKSFDGEEDISKEKKNLEEYIEDVVFQTLVLKEAYPDTTINSFLLMPDKSRRTNIEGLASWFKIKLSKDENEKFKKPEVNFIFEGTSEFESKIKLLKEDNILQLLPLDESVLKLADIIKNRTNKFLRILNSDFHYEADDYTIDKECKSCEFRANTEDSRDGYKECWGGLADETPHIFELYYGGTIGDKNEPLINQLIAKKKTSLYDFKEEDFVKKDGSVGSRNERQLIQYRNPQTNKEWYSDNLQNELKQWQFPLHFIDFETYTGAIPNHANMHPYETIAFQWSCHTIFREGEEPVHSEWINTEKKFPNFIFAESLMKQIGNTGTPLMWATHENTVLRTILNQMEIFNYHNENLKQWLINITKDKHRDGRFIDMNAFTLKNYFHPYMKGKTSIKKTLPAIWNHHPELHQIPWFKKYCQIDGDGKVSDPYYTLKYIFAATSPEEILLNKEFLEVVKEGNAAMKAYQDMLYGSPANKENLKQQLLEYCKLDTMAMVIIYTHWKNSAKNHLKDMK